MKFLIKIALIAILAATLQTFLPWWSMAIAAFAVSLLLFTRGASAFFAGFIAIFLLWSLKSYFIDVANQQLLSLKIAELFSVTPFLLIIITGTIGGIVGGFASLTGGTFRKLFSTEKRSNKYYT